MLKTVRKRKYSCGSVCWITGSSSPPRCLSGRCFTGSRPDFMDDPIEVDGKLARTQGRTAKTFCPDPEDRHPPTTYFNRKHVEQSRTRTRQRSAKPISTPTLDSVHRKHNIELLVVDEFPKPSL